MYNGKKSPKFVGCKIGGIRSRLQFLRLFLRMQNGSYGMSGDLKPSFLHSSVDQM